MLTFKFVSEVAYLCGHRVVSYTTYCPCLRGRNDTTTNISEQIRTIEFSGSTYSVSGAGVTTDGESINPKYTDLQQTLNGETYTWQQVDLNSRPNYTLNQAGGSFQFTEVYKQPSVSKITDLTRQITSESVTETTTIFSQ